MTIETARIISKCSAGRISEPAGVRPRAPRGCLRRDGCRSSSTSTSGSTLCVNEEQALQMRP